MSSVGDLLPLVDIGTESKVKQLALGKWHTCALLISNALKCWGFGGYGQLGSGSAETISSDSHGVPFVPIDSYRVISFVAAGTYHTCIVFDDMTGMRCFGHNGYGQLGQGDKLERGKTQTTMIKRIPNIDLGERKLKLTSIYLGNLFTCVIFKNSKIKCFGDNTYGQFAIGTNRNVGFGQKQMGGFLKSANIFETKSKHKKLSTAGVFAIIIALIAFLVMLAKCHIPYYFCMSIGDFYPSICCTRDSTSNSSNTSSNQARTQATVTDAAVDETVYTRLDSIPYAYPVETS